MELRRSIGSKELFLLVVNAILGTGIFFLPAIGIKYAGTSSIFSWILMSIIAVMISFVFAELISMKPESGGIYKIVKNSFSEFYGFLFGWISWIVANITIAMLVVGSFIYLFPGIGSVNAMIVSIACVLVFNYVNYKGINLSTKMLIFFGVLTLLTLLMLIIPGTFIAVSAPLDFSGFSFPLVFLSIYFIAETFFGWETTTYLADEVKNPKKVLPRMLILTTLTISIISCLLVFVAIGTDASAFAASSSPLSALFSMIYGNSYAFIFSIIVFIPLIGTAASWIIASPRLLYAMSKDKVMIQCFSSVHKKNKVPHKAILFQTAVTCILTVAAFGSFYMLLSLLVPLVIIMYTMVMYAYIKTKYSGFSGQFKSPLGIRGAWLIILMNIVLLAAWLVNVSNALYILSMGVMLVFVGFPLYVIIKMYTDRTFIEQFYDKLSFIWDPLFSIWYSEPEKNFVVSKLSLKENSKVLDFGCGTGKTTKKLAKKVTKGVVVGVDISEKQLEKAMRKMKTENINNVLFIKDYKARLEKESFDALTAIGVLEHLENPKTAINQLMPMLKKNGSFSLICFGKSFGIVGSPFFENEKTVRSLFSDVSTDLHIKKENKRFAQYWYIWGKRK